MGAGEQGKSAGETRPIRYCSNCGERVPKRARICGHCNELLDDRYKNIDEGTFRFARMVLLHDIKHDLEQWVRRGMIATLGMVALAVIFGYFGFHEWVASVVKEKVNTQVGEQLESARRRVDNIERNLSGLEKLSDQVVLSKEIDRVALVELRSHVDDVAARLTTPRISTPPPVFLKRPATVVGERPHVIYASTDSQIRFEWMPTASAERPEAYTLQFSRSREFEEVAEFGTAFEIKSISAEEIEKELGAELRGIVYWRVLPESDATQAMVGCFEYYTSAMERIGRTGMVRVGLSASESKPFVYEEKGALTGSDYELAVRIAADLQDFSEREVGDAAQERTMANFQMYDWMPLLTAPGRNEVDFIVASITIKPERERLYGFEFSNTYHVTDQALVIQKRNPSNVTSLDDLSRLVIAAQKATTGADAARMHAEGDSFLEALNVRDLLGLIVNERADVAILDREIAQDYARRERYKERIGVLCVTDVGCDGVLGDVSKETNPEFFDEYGIAVARGQDILLDAINYILEHP